MAITVSLEGSILHLVLDAPERLNAMTLTDWDDLTGVLTKFGGDESIRGLVLRGNGKAFSAGADLGFLDELHSMDDGTRSATLRRGSDLVRLLIRFPVPTTAVVDGACFGVGISLALACDRVVATPKAKFGFVFTGLGIPSGDMAATWLLCRRVGTRRAWPLLESAAVVTAPEALAMGLIDEVAEGASAEIAAGLTWTRSAPAAVRTTKRQVLEIEGAFAELDAQMETQLGELTAGVGGADFVEGLASVRERRPADFS